MAIPYSTGLPHNFVVKHTCDGREGYVFFSSIEITPQEGQPYLRMYPASHYNRYYNILTDNPLSEWARCRITKTNGTVQREIQWKHTNKRLRFQQEYIPVLNVTGFPHFPAWKVLQNFIPITTPVQQPQAPVQPAQQPEKEFSIPAHAVRALLTYADLQEESCPILDIPIDVDNGAVTSCFHVFEKRAIQQWLDTATSEKSAQSVNRYARHLAYKSNSKQKCFYHILLYNNKIGKVLIRQPGGCHGDGI